MSSYKDKNGRERVVMIDVEAVERLRSVFGVNLYDLEQLGGLAADMMRFLRVVHCATDFDPFRNDYRQTFEEWWQDHTGDAGDRCVEAFTNTLCDDFFPTRLANLVRRMNVNVSRAVEAAWSQLESEFGGTSGPSPGSSESTPAS